MTYNLLPHQKALVTAIHKYPDVTFFINIAGYGAGKSTSVVFLLLSLLHWYAGEYITFGIAGAAIKHLRETVIKDFLGILDRHKQGYKHNSQTGLIEVGTVQFVYFSLDRPESIFGWSLSGVVVDEADEISVAERVKESMTAIQERCRITLPKTKNQPVTRSPFIVMTTTAQGMRGMYMYLEFLKEKKIPYVHIKGRTKDNKYLDKQQIENLYKMYTEEEARAYLDGEFINLSTGRVYAEFFPEQHVIDVPLVQPDETIYLGADFNVGYNMAVMGVVRDGKLYITHEQHYAVVGDAPRQLRLLYPTNPIIYIPDVSGKELLVAYNVEFEQYNVQRTMSTINPPIAERVLAINKAFRVGKMFVDSSCKRLIMALQTRGFDDTGKPYKGKGMDAPDHVSDACDYLVWHVIHTITGFNDILSILRGDRWGEESYSSL